MIYNIIGDIHCRTNWKELVKKDAINIFVGDYFSPYNDISFKKGKKNFLEIINFKMNHPETILLIGNHDEDHWHIRERYSRFDFINCQHISNLFEQYKDLFQVAYSINNEVLVTHAGVSVIWYIRYKYNRYINCLVNLHEEKDTSKTINEAIEKANNKLSSEFIKRYYRDESTMYIWQNDIYWFKDGTFQKFNETPDSIAEFINNFWKNGKYTAFNFISNAGIGDSYGDDIHHSPMWIRPASLQEANIFKYMNYAQVVGHTQFKEPCTYYWMACRKIENNSLYSSEEDKIFFCDCLGQSTSSILYDNEAKIFSINNKN
ncbi:MAG: hypothetical protein [Wendovervirus sonii]|uniref:Calcineurin-like phosphoesterase domain-containing protein n=1 Tax=phage Lak_Megaphage_Sonny TaxID=3109229 RepID=A0ABZ0Z491_9CAUD|nr:MAG: hypothetical protein [phage Lak_Megaphage_Sonny]